MRKPLGWNKFNLFFFLLFFGEEGSSAACTTETHSADIRNFVIYQPFARTQGLQTACRRVGYMAARRNWNFSCNANFNFQHLFSIFVRTFHVHWPINGSSNVAGFGQFQTPRSLALSDQHLFLAQLFRDHRASGVNKATEGPHRCLIQWTLGVLDHVA